MTWVTRWWAMTAAGCAVAMALVVSAGCTNQDDSSPPQSAPTTAQPTYDNLEGVAVTGEVGAAPTVTLKPNLQLADEEFQRIVPGDGNEAGQGSFLRVHYSIVDGETGEGLGSSYNSAPQYLLLSEGATVDHYLTGLDGAKAGSRTVFARPGSAAATATTSTHPAVSGESGDTGGADAAPKTTDKAAATASHTTGADGSVTSQAAPPSPTETTNAQVVVMDVIEVLPARAAGKQVKPSATMPQVSLEDNGSPTVKIPQGPVPDNLLVQPLIEGPGEQVAAGQTITVMFTGVKWADGKVFESTWQSMTPIDMVVGTENVLKAWNTAIVGLPVGSQVLVAAPPSQAYGGNGNKALGISGSDTLVYVIDILDAR